MSKCNISCAGSSSSLKTGAVSQQSRGVGRNFEKTAGSLLHGFLDFIATPFVHSKARDASISSEFAHSIQLLTGELWSSGISSPVRILCENGTLWVTLSGDANDYLVRSGEEIVAPRSPHLVVSSLGGPAMFRIQEFESR